MGRLGFSDLAEFTVPHATREQNRMNRQKDGGGPRTARNTRTGRLEVRSRVMGVFGDSSSTRSARASGRSVRRSTPCASLAVSLHKDHGKRQTCDCEANRQEQARSTFWSLVIRHTVEVRATGRRERAVSGFWSLVNDRAVFPLELSRISCPLDRVRIGDLLDALRNPRSVPA